MKKIRFGLSFSERDFACQPPFFARILDIVFVIFHLEARFKESGNVFDQRQARFMYVFLGFMVQFLSYASPSNPSESEAEVNFTEKMHRFVLHCESSYF